MDISLCELHFLLKKLNEYEEGIYYTIKSLIRYKFKSNEVLKEAVYLYTNKETFEEAYKKYFHISLWDTSLITNMSYLFEDPDNIYFFNENLNGWFIRT